MKFSNLIMAALTAATIIPAAHAAQHHPNPKPAMRVAGRDMAAVKKSLVTLLQLTRPQQEKLTAHRKDIGLRLSAAMVGGNPDPKSIQDIWARDRKGMKKILTPKQWAKYEKLGHTEPALVRLSAL